MKIVKQLGVSFLLLSLIVCFQNCSGGFKTVNESSSQSASGLAAGTTPTDIQWQVNSQLNFIAGSSDKIDLSMTLPAGVKPNGTFYVDTSGANLPMGMSLSPAGVLSVGSASVIEVAGIVFRYEEP